MVDRSVPLTAAIVVILLLCAPTSHAQPAAITGLATETALEPAELNAIEAFAEYWVERLRPQPQNDGDHGSDDEAVRRARRALLQPLEAPGVTVQFRNAYSDAAIEPLRNLLENDNTQGAVNATIVLGRLGTKDALERLLAASALPAESRWNIRLAAARECRVLFSRADLTLLRPADLTSATRRLRNAARAETHPGPLRYQLQAILAADPPGLPAPARAQIRDYYVDALNSVAERARELEAQQAYQMIDAVTLSLLRMRNIYINLPADRQEELGRRLGPALARLLDSLTVHWARLHAATESRERIGIVVTDGETVLRVVDRFVVGSSPIDSALADAWRNDDLPAYQRDIERWLERTSRRPYLPP